jgi:hypothetical protein
VTLNEIAENQESSSSQAVFPPRLTSSRLIYAGQKGEYRKKMDQRFVQVWPPNRAVCFDPQAVVEAKLRQGP